jgi:hypothetical protein
MKTSIIAFIFVIMLSLPFASAVIVDQTTFITSVSNPAGGSGSTSSGGSGGGSGSAVYANNTPPESSSTGCSGLVYAIKKGTFTCNVFNNCTALDGDWSVVERCPAQNKLDYDDVCADASCTPTTVVQEKVVEVPVSCTAGEELSRNCQEATDGVMTAIVTHKCVDGKFVATDESCPEDKAGFDYLRWAIVCAASVMLALCLVFVFRSNAFKEKGRDMDEKINSITGLKKLQRDDDLDAINANIDERRTAIEASDGKLFE